MLIQFTLFPRSKHESQGMSFCYFLQLLLPNPLPRKSSKVILDSISDYIAIQKIRHKCSRITKIITDKMAKLL